MIRTGRLTVAYAGGEARTYGDGVGPEVAVRINPTGARRIALQPGLGLGEAYMDGDLVIERGGLWDLMDIVGRNLSYRPVGRGGAVGKWFKRARKRFRQWNGRAASRRNVAHHYDLSRELYAGFLDADMQYSCAYFPRPGMSIDEAQAAKKAHIAAKLNLEPGHRVLDIGCGWGGMGLELARAWGAQVTGITLSAEQLAVAKERVRTEGLDGKVDFQLIDYRDLTGRFDRIVSVGMFEHVGTPNYQTFFDAVARLLDDRGVALIHTIGRTKGPGVTNAFTAKYIFPGGYVPALSEVMPAIERAGLRVADVEVLRIHYAETLRHWRERFMAMRDEAERMYDARFCRMWEYYMASAEMGFRYGDQVVFQLQIVKRFDALPITRDYIAQAEAAHAAP
jgi:cyclopropane-fatty-acyl-phospholipid synthase